MHPCVNMIREDITKVTKDRLAPVRDGIKKDIRYALWHGFIDENLYIKLLKELDDKIDTLWE
jgi:hypothetical protein